MKQLFIIVSLLFSIMLTSVSAVDVTQEAKITGLYVGYFDRAADQEGLEYWTAKSDEVAQAGGDTSLVFKKLSAGFATHPTFKSTYDHLNNKEFVSLIYRNALGRDGDAEGIAYWTKKLDNEGMIRSDMVSDFVELSLVTDLTPENYPNLPDAELAAGQLRQDLITNKVTVALAFTHQLGVLSNVVDSQNPEGDPAYLASIKIISEVAEDPETVFSALISLDAMKGELGGVEEGVTYPYPNISEVSDENRAVTQSLKETQAALLQAILLINSYIYTDPSVTDYSEYEKRRQRAIDAFNILDEKISSTLAYEEAENAILVSSKLQSLKSVEDQLFTTSPQNGNRPIKDLLEGYQRATGAASDTLQLKMSSDNYQDPSKYPVKQKELEAAVEIGKLPLIYVGGIAGVAIAAGVVGGTAAFVPAILTVGTVTVIAGVSQIVKIGISLVHWKNAAYSEKQEPVPGILKDVQNVAEFTTLVAMNGVGVILYAGDKLIDLIVSGGKTISFGAEKIQVMKLTQEILDIPKGIDPSKWPTTGRGVYITPDGKRIIVTGLPKEYYEKFSNLDPEGRLIMMPPVATPIDREFAGSVDVTLVSPDNAYVVYRVNGGELLLYTEPITLTETSTIVAYADRDPYDPDAEFSEVSTSTYTKKVGWTLSETIVYTDPNINAHECYESSLNLSSGSFSSTTSVPRGICNWKYNESITFTGSWTPPPSSLVPGNSYPMSANISRSNSIEQWGADDYISLHMDAYDIACGYGTAGSIGITDGYIKVGWRASDPSTNAWSGTFTAPSIGYHGSNETGKFAIKANVRNGCIRYIYEWAE